MLKRQAVEEYLTISEVAARLKLKPKTIKNKMAAGIFQRGIHYFSRPGISPRFKWSAVVAWLEEGNREMTLKEPATYTPRFEARKPKGLDIGPDLA